MTRYSVLFGSIIPLLSPFKTNDACKPKDVKYNIVMKNVTLLKGTIPNGLKLNIF